MAHTITLPTPVVMSPPLAPMPRPDPERSQFSRKSGGVCVVSDGRADRSLAATVRRLEAATMLRPVLNAEAMHAARQAGATSTRPATQTTAASWSPTDVIVSVAPNPKKPGSSTRERYEHWRVGDTLAQALARGLTRADVAWDLERGFVTVRSA